MVALGLAAPAAEASIRLSPITEHRILSELRANEPRAARIYMATVVRHRGADPLICGFMTTREMRRRGVVKMFLWEGKPLSLSYHDLGTACLAALTARSQHIRPRAD